MHLKAKGNGGRERCARSRAQQLTRRREQERRVRRNVSFSVAFNPLILPRKTALAAQLAGPLKPLRIHNSRQNSEPEFYLRSCALPSPAFASFGRFGILFIALCVSERAHSDSPCIFCAPPAALRVKDGIKCRRICGGNQSEAFRCSRISRPDLDQRDERDESERALIVIRRASLCVRWNKVAFEIGDQRAGPPTETRHRERTSERAWRIQILARALFFGRRRKHGILLRLHARSLAAVRNDILLGSFPKLTTSLDVAYEGSATSGVDFASRLLSRSAESRGMLVARISGRIDVA